jgi:hypothetical protein
VHDQLFCCDINVNKQEGAFNMFLFIFPADTECNPPLAGHLSKNQRRNTSPTKETKEPNPEQT